MPYLKITVNREVAAERRKALLKTASDKTAKALGKPESYVMVELQAGTELVFAGSDEPAAYLELKSIGLPSVQLRALSKLLCGLLQDELAVDPGRVYIEFTDIKGSSWGWNGSTF